MSSIESKKNFRGNRRNHFISQEQIHAQAFFEPRKNTEQRDQKRLHKNRTGVGRSLGWQHGGPRSERTKMLNMMQNDLISLDIASQLPNSDQRGVK